MVSVEQIGHLRISIFPMIPLTNIDSNSFEYVAISEILHEEVDDIFYDLAVDADESFIANGIVVHNCRHNWEIILPPEGEARESLREALDRWMTGESVKKTEESIPAWQRGASGFRAQPVAKELSFDDDGNAYWFWKNTSGGMEFERA